MKVNWPLVGIGAGALVTAGVIVAIVTSSATTVSGTTILTLDQLGDTDFPTVGSQPTTLQLGSDGCFDVSTSAGTGWAIWPEGTTQDGDHIVLLDGTRLGDGDAFTSDSAIVTKAKVPALVGSSGPASIAQFCAGTDGPVTILASAS